MAAITIQGIKITSVDISRDNSGKPNITGKYELMGSNGIALAKQGFNGYQDIAISHSPATHKALRDLLESIRGDINLMLGLE